MSNNVQGLKLLENFILQGLIQTDRQTETEGGGRGGGGSIRRYRFGGCVKNATIVG